MTERHDTLREIYDLVRGGHVLRWGLSDIERELSTLIDEAPENDVRLVEVDRAVDIVQKTRATLSELFDEHFSKRGDVEDEKELRFLCRVLLAHIDGIAAEIKKLTKETTDGAA
jgi:hypothetical protein